MKGHPMIQAWHFVGPTLRNGDPVPPDGEWLVYKGVLSMCESGLHASRRPWHALSYAPGATLCLVDCDGEVIEQDDKLVCSRRRIVTRMDFIEPLRYFARMQALSVMHLWEAPDVVLDYLMTGEESIRAAARDAAGDAARAAAGDAAGGAAWGVPAWAAVGAAARDAAGDAAWDAAWDAARAAAWDAAWAAARAAAGD